MLNPRKYSANRAYREASLYHHQALRGLQASLDLLSKSVSNLHLEMKTSVRQFHSDTTASHSALVNLKRNSGETTPILATSHKETLSFREDLAEMKIMLAALTSSDGRAILPKLVSKPDALRKICDSAPVERRLHSTLGAVSAVSNTSLH